MYRLFKKIESFTENFTPQGRIWLETCNPSSNLFKFFQPINSMFRDLTETLNRYYMGLYPCQTNLLIDNFINEFDLNGGVWSDRNNFNYPYDFPIIFGDETKNNNDTKENDLIVAKHLIYKNTDNGYNQIANHYGICIDVSQTHNKISDSFNYFFPFTFGKEFPSIPNCDIVVDDVESCGFYDYFFPIKFGKCEKQLCNTPLDVPITTDNYYAKNTEHCKKCSKGKNKNKCESGWTDKNIKDDLKAKAEENGDPTYNTITTTKTTTKDTLNGEVVVVDSSVATKQKKFNNHCECEISRRFKYQFPLKFGKKPQHCFEDDYYSCALCGGETSEGDNENVSEDNGCECEDTPDTIRAVECFECPYVEDEKCLKVYTNILFYGYNENKQTIEKLKRIFERLKPLGCQFVFSYTDTVGICNPQKFCYDNNEFPIN